MSEQDQQQPAAEQARAGEGSALEHSSAEAITTTEQAASAGNDDSRGGVPVPAASASDTTGEPGKPQAPADPTGADSGPGSRPPLDGAAVSRGLGVEQAGQLSLMPIRTARELALETPDTDIGEHAAAEHIDALVQTVHQAQEGGVPAEFAEYVAYKAKVLRAGIAAREPVSHTLNEIEDMSRSVANIPEELVRYVRTALTNIHLAALQTIGTQPKPQ